ncbi:MAG TPA: 30S ribosomal protein S16, partial [Gemmatimonadaceae bacterium]
MVRIRLRRIGRKKAPVYRIVVADSQSPRDGRFIEIIGQYTPRQKGGEGGLKVDEARADYWLG